MSEANVEIVRRSNEHFLRTGALIVLATRGKGSGLALRREDAIVYRLEQGQIVRMDYYGRRAEALESVGLAPS